MSDIEKKLKQLAEARASVKAADDFLKGMLDAVRSSAEYQEVAMIKVAKFGLVEELEEAIKAWAITHFDGKNKKPHLKVSIKSFDTSKVTYNAQRAHDWCVRNFTPALKLDEKLFEKMALAGQIPADVAIIEFGTEDRVQIAADLSDYLESA